MSQLTRRSVPGESFRTVGQVEILMGELFRSISSLDDGVCIPELVSDALDSVCCLGEAPCRELEGSLALASSGVERMRELFGTLSALSGELEDRLCRYSV
nr:hypothetical protein [Clostridia bacterium]